MAERRVALVMAADDYRLLRPLDNAVNDAQAMERALEGLGFDVSFETNRDLRRMRRALDDFRQDAQGADVALVFFAGHGVEIGGENRLLPVDADAASLDALKASSLPLEEVSRTVAAVAGIGLILLDACRNDPFGAAGTTGRSAAPLKAEVASAARPGLGRMGQARNMLFAFSAAPGETASDGDGANSPFSAALAKYLGTGGLEIRSVLTLVQQEVYDLSAGSQLPYVESGLPQLFFADKARQDLPERERLLLAMADVTPELRAEVERVATDAGMPLAPLYGALISSDGPALTAEERGAKLAEAAAAFVKVREEMRSFSSADPEVARLRGLAQEQLTLGAFDTARERLAQAAAIDASSRAVLKTNLTGRTISEAATHALSGGASRADLRYDLALAEYRKAANLYAEIEDVAIPADEVERHWLTLQALGDINQLTGNLNGAAGAYGELNAAIGKRLENDPGNVQWRRDLAISHNKRANIFLLQGSLQAAYDGYEASRQILAKLAEEQPKSQGWRGDLAVAVNKIGNVLASAGDVDAAAEAYDEALGLREQLVREDPDYPEWQRDLSISWDEIGDLRRATGDLPGALEAFETSVELRTRLAEADPGNAELKRDLWVSLERIGNIRRLEGRTADALEAYRAALEVMEPLAASDPNNTQWQRDLSINHERIGIIQRDGKDFDAAERSFRFNLETAERLAALDPTNMEWQRDLSVSLEKLADVLRSKKDFRAALGLLERGLGISARLAAADPGNKEWQRDLAVSYSEIGDVLSRLGDDERAIPALAESLRIHQELAASDPGNADWQRDLIVSYWWLADAGADPRGNLTKALQIAEELQASGRLQPRDAGVPGYLRDRLARMKPAKKRR